MPPLPHPASSKVCARTCLTALVVLATACTSAPPPAPPPPTTAPAAPKPSTPSLTSIHATYSNLVATELPVWLALDQGIFAKHGLDVDLRLADSGAGMPALLSGEVQIIDIAVPQVLSAAAGGAQVVDVAENSPLQPYLLQVSPDIKTASDLRGKKVGISSPGSASDIATRVVLRRLGLDPDTDVAIVAVGSAAARIAAMQNGAIQAALAIPPDTLLLADKGFGTLFDLAEQKVPTGNATQTTTRAYLEAHRDVVQAWVDADVEAIALAKRDRATTIAVLKKYLKSDDERGMQAAYDFVIQQVIPPLPYPRPDQFVDSQAFLAAQNPNIKDVDLNTIIDRSLVQSAADRKVGQ